LCLAHGLVVGVDVVGMEGGVVMMPETNGGESSLDRIMSELKEVDEIFTEQGKWNADILGIIKELASFAHHHEDDDPFETCQCDECRPHTSDCAVHNEPAYPKGPCDCRDAALGEDTH